MPCLEKLTDFEKPFSYGQYPAMATHINFDTDKMQYLALPVGQYQQAGHVDCAIWLYWLNSAGGRENFQFTGSHTYSIDISNGVVYRDQDNQEVYASRGQVRNKVIVNSGFVSLADKKALMGILKSIKVWWKVGSGFVEEDFALIKIEEGQYIRHKQTDQFYALSFAFQVARIESVQIV